MILAPEGSRTRRASGIPRLHTQLRGTPALAGGARVAQVQVGIPRARPKLNPRRGRGAIYMPAGAGHRRASGIPLAPDKARGSLGMTKRGTPSLNVIPSPPKEGRHLRMQLRRRRRCRWESPGRVPN